MAKNKLEATYIRYDLLCLEIQRLRDQLHPGLSNLERFIDYVNTEYFQPGGQFADYEERYRAVIDNHRTGLTNLQNAEFQMLLSVAGELPAVG
jgi:hypothetical protein